MAKQTFAAKTFAAKSFACGVWVGVGSAPIVVDPPFWFAVAFLYTAGAERGFTYAPGAEVGFTFAPGAEAGTTETQ